MVETTEELKKKTLCGRRKLGDGNIAWRAGRRRRGAKEEAAVGPGGRLMEAGTRL